MPQPKVILDYQACDPSRCENGVCAAAQVCERKVLKQANPGELPELYPSLCQGCIDCIKVCPCNALRLIQ
jgi:NAD-dependent dihydropyrimidine dehydrogenase PreA subunit